jgi:hypothetical protein
MTVSVKMCQEPSTVARGLSEVHREDSAARLQDSPDFTNTRLTCFDRQMMKHQGAQDSVEVRVGKRQCFGRRIFENDLSRPSFWLPIGSVDHFGRGINSSHNPRRTHALLGSNHETSCATTYV